MKLTVSSNPTLLKSIPTRAARSPMSYRWLSLFTLLMSGCCMSKADELAAVAKDWSLTIRASQVIPVYPLTEDLEPGDVFLVQTPLQEQAEAYEANGFLPLDQHLVRLHPKAFADFYDKSFGIKTNTDTPHHWQFPPVPVQVPAQLPAAGGGATKGKAVLVGGTQEGDTKKDGDAKEAAIPPYPPTDWTNAPLAGFPTYNFSVKKGGGLNLAVPVQGVPIALGATASSSATGSITIADAHTYGLDIATLSKKLKNWADDNKELLANYLPVILPGEKKLTYFYVRVVTRVYLAGRVNVTLNSDKSFAANLSGGDPKEVVLPGTESRTPPSRTSETNPDKPEEKPEERPQDKAKVTINGLYKGPDAILP